MTNNLATQHNSERCPWLQSYEQNVPVEIDYPAGTLVDAFRASVKTYPDKPALIYYDSVFSYREFGRMVDSLASALTALNVKQGDRVSLHMPNCPQYVIGYYAALSIGAVVVPTNPMYVAEELEYQLRDSGAETIITLTKMYPTVQAARHNTPLRNVIVGNIKDYFAPEVKKAFTENLEEKEGHRVNVDTNQPGNYLFTDLMERYDGEVPPSVGIKQGDLASLQYTGGTTGVSKGAMLTHRNLLVNATQMRYWITDHRDGEEVSLTVLPIFHSYGMTLAMNYPVLGAAAMILMPKFQTKEALELIEKYRPTLFCGVPTMYIAINNYPEVATYDLSSIRACICGASTLPASVQEKFESLTGARLVEGYGLTEASPVTHINPVNGTRKAGTIGVPWCDTVARIMDLETGEREMPHGEPGELVVRGPQVMQGYWNATDETALVLRDGWLYTGDIAKMDDDGFFSIVDRKKDMIIASGYSIYPRDIDEVLYRHPKVREAVSVGVPDEYRGETVKAFIVLKPGETAIAEEIIEFCKQHLAPYKVPTKIEFRESLPTSGAGKVLRRLLQEDEKRKLTPK